MDHQQTTILILAVCLLVSMLGHAVGLVWAIARERYFVRITSQQTSALIKLNETITGGTKGIRSGFRMLREKIKHSAKLTAQKRREMMQLMLDTERRCMDAIRDLGIALQLQGIHTGGGVTIQNTAGNTSGVQIGDGTNKQEGV